MKAAVGVKVMSVRVTGAGQWDIQQELENGEEQTSATLLCVGNGAVGENRAELDTVYLKQLKDDHS